MTNLQQAGASPRSRVLFAAGLAAIGLVFLIWQAVLATGACPLPERVDDAEGQALLDAEHSWVEQRVTVSIDPQALPAGLPEGAVTLSVLPVAPGQPSSASDPSPFQVFFVDDETGLALPRVGGPETAGTLQVDRTLASVGLDCRPGEPCRRALRVVLVWDEPVDDRSVAVSWTVRLKVNYGRTLAPCVPPSAGMLEVSTAAPSVGASADLVTARVPSMIADGALAARHYTIRTAGDTAAHPSVLRVGVTPIAGAPYGWQGWIRMIPDDARAPVVDAHLGDVAAIPPQTADAPVLTDCQPGRPCERGYWVVIQSFSGVPSWDGQPFGDEHVHAVHIAAEAISWGAGAGDSAISIVLDDVNDGLGAMSIVDVPTQEFEVPHSDEAMSVEIGLTFDRPRPVNGLDPMVAGMALVPLFVEGVDVTMALEGDGATPLTARFSGHHTNYLLAHPSDACAEVAVGASCTATFRMLIDVPPQQQYGSQHDGADVEWALHLLGVPRGTTYAIAQPVEIPRVTSPVKSDLPIAIAIVVTSGLVLILLIGTAERRRRRRASRSS